jgi:GntR family transcriptional regulator/MocR family aminotransferase
MFELALNLPARGSRELLRSLHGQLRAAILDGRLKPGLRLPPTRAMASAQRVSRNTVVAAYELLLTEGYLTTRRGGGTFVADSLPRRPVEKSGIKVSARNSGARAGDVAGADKRLAALWRSHSPLVLEPEGPAPRFDFRLGSPDRQHFPFDVWRRLYTRALRAMAKAGSQTESPQGRERLRAAIARYVSFTRAVACGPDDVIVTTGAQQAFDLLSRVLVTSNRMTVAVENPGYLATRTAFATAGARVAATPVDENGMVISRLASSARVICVTPSHQFPLGSVLSMERRVALLDFARAHDAVIVEDDYDGEFRFGGRPLDALQTLDRADAVFYVGTFSKSLFPAIRVGYIVAPSWARRALAAAKQLSDGQSPLVTQDALADFISEGHLARHVRRMRSIYGARRTALLDGLYQMPKPWLEPLPSSAGLHITAFTHPSIDANALEARARERGVGVRSLSSFYVKKPERAGLAFGLGLIAERDIVPALEILNALRRK